MVMRRYGRFLLGGICLVLAAIILLSQVTAVPGLTPILTTIGALGGNNQALEKTDGSYYTMVNEKGRVLMYTGLPVVVGDEFIAEDNSRYRVTRVSGDTAYARFVNREEISWNEEDVVGDFALAEGETGSGEDVPALSLSGPYKGTTKGRAFIGIYHTHSDESYIPSDGADSIYGNGGILKVGTTLTRKLEEIGVKAVQSVQSHCPHDAAAYDRSRRTALQLMKLKPIALLDVHRDAGPAHSYARRVRNQDVTGIRIVVGRRNPHFGANLEFAKKVKALLDKTHPGLSAGIFIAHADYNQDLSPQTMLLEVGTERNSREEAERGIALFADAIPKVLGMSGVSTREVPQTTAATGDRASRSSLTYALWFLAALVVGAVAYLWINAGSWEKAVQDLRGFAEKELGLMRKTLKSGTGGREPGDNQGQEPEDRV